MQQTSPAFIQSAQAGIYLALAISAPPCTSEANMHTAMFFNLQDGAIKVQLRYRRIAGLVSLDLIKAICRVRKTLG